MIPGRIRASEPRCARKLRVVFRAAARAPLVAPGPLRVRTTGSGTLWPGRPPRMHPRSSSAVPWPGSS